MRVRYLDGAVEVEVSDDGYGTASAAGAGTGMGIVGMRERVTAIGGTLEAGPKSRGGYLVRATMPTASAA